MKATEQVGEVVMASNQNIPGGGGPNPWKGITLNEVTDKVTVITWSGGNTVTYNSVDGSIKEDGTSEDSSSSPASY